MLGMLAFSGCGPRKNLAEKGIDTQTLHVGNAVEPVDLDPHAISGVAEIRILSALFEGLVGQDPHDLSPIPGMAESWDISDDGLTYTFHLREDARWSDGNPLGAEDFAFAYERILSPDMAAPNASLLFTLRNAQAFNQGKTSFDQVGVQVIAAHTLQLTLAQATPYLLHLLSHPAWYPLPQQAIEQHGDRFAPGNRWTRPGNLVSNGPFQLTDWKVNQYVQVSANPLYWDAGNVRLSQIFFYPTESRDGEERSFLNGQLHITDALPVSKVKQYIDRRDPALRIDPYLGTYYLQLNTRIQGLDDPRVRRALSLAIDREALVRTVLQGAQEVAWQFTPPGTPGYRGDYQGTYDPDQARSLLAAAGYPDGKGFPQLSYLYNTSENHKLIAEALQQMWKVELGIDIQPYNQEYKVYMQSRTQGEFNILRSSWIGDYLDASTFLKVFESGSDHNYTGWNSSAYDQAITIAGSTLDSAKRNTAFDTAEAVLRTECPIIPIYHYNSIYLKNPAVQGYYPTLLNLHPWKFVYLESVTATAD